MDYLNHSLIKNEDECELLIQNLLVFGTANETERNEEKKNSPGIIPPFVR